jgi:hypothetical protein
VRRAARYDGLFPIGVPGPDDLAAMVALVADERTADTPFDVAVQGGVGVDPAPWIAAGATWWLIHLDAYTVSAAAVRDAIRQRPRL